MAEWPTSLLPYLPQGRPTISPEDTTEYEGYPAVRLFKYFISAVVTALPGPERSNPNPSKIIRNTFLKLILFVVRVYFNTQSFVLK